MHKDFKLALVVSFSHAVFPFSKQHRVHARIKEDSRTHLPSLYALHLQVPFIGPMPKKGQGKPRVPFPL